MFRWVLIVCLVAAPTFRVSEADLSCDRDHPSDTLQVITEDPALVYKPVQVEVAASRPFCATLSKVGEAGAAPLWSGCYVGALHRFTEDALGVPGMPGGPGRALSVQVTTMPKGDPVALHAQVQLVVSALALPPDAGSPFTPDAGLKPDGGRP